MNKLCVTILLATSCFSVYSQSDKDRKHKLASIAFYNVENLYDTIDSPNTSDFEFTPQGPNQWNSSKYFYKLDRLGEVISQLGGESNPDGPAIIGLAEIENRSVLEDLVKNKKLKRNNYKIAHFDSPDIRGVDLALLYNPVYFKLLNSKAYRLRMPDDTSFKTRDQLLVSGLLDGELFHFIVGHWPSRRNGQKLSNPKRIEAAKLGRKIIDSIISLDGNARIVYMGDLNDDPVNESVKDMLNTSSKIEKTKGGKLYNPMYELYNDGIGTLAWNDSWNLFDQIILSQPLINESQLDWQFYKVKVYNKEYLRQKDGNYKGYPFRTFSGGQYTGGYSDHFPVYVILKKYVE
jgi:hypothetical protein